jgi:flagellar hook-associated protein 1 FlgK
MNALNKMAKAVVIDTNTVHRQGDSLNNINGADPDGINFYNQDGLDEDDPTIEWAKVISVDAQIIADVKNIAAASSRTRDDSGTAINLGDGGNALLLAQLKQSRSGVLAPVTLDDYWTAQVSSIGVLYQEATRMVENQGTLLNQLELRRQETAGVSLDEEMTNMIKFQHAYNAAARYITAIDEAIDVIVNRMGLTGR